MSTSPAASSRHSAVIPAIFLAGLLLRIAVSVWNAYFGPSFGGEGDALSFHEFAVAAAAGHVDERDFTTGWIYPSLLALIYQITTPSLFIGGLLSAVAWWLSAFVLLKLCRVVAVSDRALPAIALIYALLPSSFLVTAITLREAYQMLFVNLMMLFGLQLVHRLRAFPLFFFALSAYAAAWMHAALAAFGLAAAIILFAAKMLHRGMRIAAPLIAIGALAIALLGAAAVIGYDPSSSISDLVSAFREGTPDDARTNYPSTLAFGSMYELIAAFPAILTQYLFEPMPWRIGGLADVYLFMENIGRFVLIIAALKNVASTRPIRADLLALTACYFACEAIWAIGTVNWGTASRHHLPTLGCLLVIGFARYGRVKPQAVV